jgi:hypothetical protein
MMVMTMLMKMTMNTMVAMFLFAELVPYCTEISYGTCSSDTNLSYGTWSYSPEVSH